jgi:hypothetical protein
MTTFVKPRAGTPLEKKNMFHLYIKPSTTLNSKQFLHNLKKYYIWRQTRERIGFSKNSFEGQRHWKDVPDGSQAHMYSTVLYIRLKNSVNSADPDNKGNPLQRQNTFISLNKQ